MNIFIPLRSARAGCLRAVRGVLGWYLRKSRNLRGVPILYQQVNGDLRTAAFFLLRHLPHPRPWAKHPQTPQDLEALVQRQYGWHNPTHGRRGGYPHVPK